MTQREERGEREREKLAAVDSHESVTIETQMEAQGWENLG